MACTIVDSKDRYFQEMNCAVSSQISPKQASDPLRSWISIPMESRSMRILPTSSCSAFEQVISCRLTNSGSSQLERSPTSLYIPGSSRVVKLERRESLCSSAEPARAHGPARLESARDVH